MKCPICSARIGITVGSADGFVAADTPIKECASCKTVWTAKNGQVNIVVMGSTKVKQ